MTFRLASQSRQAEAARAAAMFKRRFAAAERDAANADPALRAFLDNRDAANAAGEYLDTAIGLERARATIGRDKCRHAFEQDYRRKAARHG